MAEQSDPMYELEVPAPSMVEGTRDSLVMVHGLEGFSDAGHAVALATAHLREHLETELVASFAIDDLLDYRSRRPFMTFRRDRYTEYAAPELNLYAVRDGVGTPFLLLAGLEPDLKWERFTTAVRLLSERLGVSEVVGLDSIPMAAPHTRPIGITAHSSDKDLTAGYHKWPGEMQIPSSVSSLLEFRMGQHGYPSVGFSVHVPHYLAQSDYPAASQALLEAVSELTSLQLPTAALTESAARIREQIDAQVEENEEVRGVVEALERQYDAFVTREEHQADLLAADGELPSGDELGAEFEKFLAEYNGEEDGPGFGLGPGGPIPND